MEENGRMWKIYASVPGGMTKTNVPKQVFGKGVPSPGANCEPYDQTTKNQQFTKKI